MEFNEEIQKCKDIAARDLPRLVVCAIIIRDDKVLLEQRAPTGVRGLDYMWDLPGGKVECGESPEDSIIREIAEELSIRIRPRFLIPYLPTSTWVYADGQRRHWILAAFVCDIISGEIVCTPTLKWRDLSDMSEVLDADRHLIKMACGE